MDERTLARIERIEDRLKALETKAESESSAQADAAGAVLAELGAVASNNRKLASDLHALKKETDNQGVILMQHGRQLEDLAVNDARQNKALTDLQVAVSRVHETITQLDRWKKYLIVASPAVVAIVQHLWEKLP